jgi:hypothetical protein
MVARYVLWVLLSLLASFFMTGSGNDAQSTDGSYSPADATPEAGPAGIVRASAWQKMVD